MVLEDREDELDEEVEGLIEDEETGLQLPKSG